MCVIAACWYVAYQFQVFEYDKCIIKMFNRLSKEEYRGYPYDDYDYRIYQKKDSFDNMFSLGILIIVSYIMMLILLPSISCFYNDGDWVQCFVDGFALRYCPNITVDFNDWKSIILLITWMLF